MSFLGNIFHKKEKGKESVVLIDLSAESVAGAYVYLEEGKAPAILYARRLPIEIRTDEPHEDALLRALKILGEELIREGAPTLLRATGSGRSDTVLVSIDTPWEETRVRTEKFEREKPFVLTKSMVTTAMEKSNAVVPGKVLADESIIGTILNGYETKNPYGKKVHRASIIVLTSLIDAQIAHGITTILKELFHTKHILSIAGSSLRYQAMRKSFQHEHDALILDVTGSSISIALVRKDLFIALAEVSNAADDRPWIQKVMNEFATLAEKYPLPRIIFLLAREVEIESFRKMLSEEKFEKLWLSDTPPKIVPVLASHLASSVRQVTMTPLDLQLLLMALFIQTRPAE